MYFLCTGTVLFNGRAYYKAEVIGQGDRAKRVVW